ncbi:hypothetical protein PSEUBRA_004358 [Kalmanozyma brasiliensis GHG001]|uniref:Uncharacterized protein n=1 Tax=Kalmanozyma brasiliensis (strain GHG001) TaxID=1365824 RepID=V5ETQ5_KALBG|nr:uncharacterized protein PSEUBRA_004358 [Kalmanozyma brasiliensis GHG001]EST06458.1 hypothetical protein PSEUBRA_004358 [Kalmanozyma brasiliensis GHG001]
MQSYSSSSTSLHEQAADKKSKRKLLNRLTLRPKTAPTSNRSSAFGASQSVTSLALSADGDMPSSRRALDMFSSSRTVDAYATMPSTPKSPKFSRSKSSHDVRSAPSTRSTSASVAAMGSTVAPPVPAVPKTYLISDEVFVIAAPPAKLSEKHASVRMSKSYSSPSSQSMALSSSTQSSGSWVENLGTPAPEEVPDFEEALLSLTPEESEDAGRSSLDAIDDQIVLNLCLNLYEEVTPVESVPSSESGDLTPKMERFHSRAGSETATPPVPSIPAKHARRHTRTASAPLSLGPLPPQPSQPPTQAVLRKTDDLKKRYSKQSPTAFSVPRFAEVSRSTPGTPKLDSISDLKHLELDLSLDSRMAKRNHQRSLSRAASATKLETSYFDLPPQALEEEEYMVSRWSEDSDGDDARRIFSLLGSVKLPSVFSHSNSDVRSGGSKTPEMIAARHSSSSSTSSSVSDLSELTPTVSKEEVFDFSRQSLDYRTVYALAQAYAKTSTPSQKRQPLTRSASHRGPEVKRNFSKALRTQDPLDRSYHLRK